MELRASSWLPGGCDETIPALLTAAASANLLAIAGRLGVDLTVADLHFLIGASGDKVSRG
jgi:dihydroxyacid dehydratase/phosphogluconate dehydratase